MDPALLASALHEFLAPALPVLLGLSGKAAEAAATESGKAGVKKLWEKLKPKIEGKEAAKEAAADLAADPSDADAQAAFRRQLKKLLSADEELAGEVARSLGVAGVAFQAEQTGSGGLAQGSDQSVAGERGVAAHGGVHNSQLFTGDIHQVHIGAAAKSAGSTAGLRASYLSHLFTQLRKLALSGVDPELASDAKAQMDLDAVYTALLTRSEVSPEHGSEPDALVRQGTPRRQLSALELLDRHSRLVLLGDPGSGKSTFVSFVALCLAGEVLGREDANLALLTSPLPREEEYPRGEEDEPDPQPWRHGPLLPVRVVLRDFAASGLPKRGTQAGACHLLDFLRAELERSALGDFAPELEAELRDRGGLLLLDGLDEVPEAEARRVQLRRSLSTPVRRWVRSIREHLHGCRVG